LAGKQEVDESRCGGLWFVVGQPGTLVRLDENVLGAGDVGRQQVDAGNRNADGCRISPVSASSTSTRMPRRIASSAMIRAYGLGSSTVSGGWVNSGSLIAFLRFTASTGTR
jgi:hypothetical protein